MEGERGAGQDGEGPAAQPQGQESASNQGQPGCPRPQCCRGACAKAARLRVTEAASAATCLPRERTGRSSQLPHGAGNASPCALLSNRLIAEDKEGGLFTVTLFRKVIDDFKTKAKENK